MVNYNINNVYSAIERNETQIYELSNKVADLDDKCSRIEEAIRTIATDIASIRSKLTLAHVYI